MSNHEQDDKALDEYLEGNSEISKRYRAENTEGPSSSLDEKILSAAKEAVTESKPKPRIRFHKAPWAKPVSIAAIITLSVSLIITMQQETGQSVMSDSKEINGSLTTPAKKLVKPQSISADAVAPVMQDAEIKLNNDETSYDIAPDEAALGAVGGYREKMQRSKAELEARQRSERKLMFKEKARNEMEKPEVLEEQALFAAPAEADMSSMAAMEPVSTSSEQEQLLLEIKSLLEQGQLEQAKEKLKLFRESYSDYSEEAMKEVIGEELFGMINSD